MADDAALVLSISVAARLFGTNDGRMTRAERNSKRSAASRDVRATRWSRRAAEGDGSYPMRINTTRHVRSELLVTNVMRRRDPAVTNDHAVVMQQPAGQGI